MTSLTKSMLNASITYKFVGIIKVELKKNTPFKNMINEILANETIDFDIDALVDRSTDNEMEFYAKVIKYLRTNEKGFPKYLFNDLKTSIQLSEKNAANQKQQPQEKKQSQEKQPITKESILKEFIEKFPLFINYWNSFDEFSNSDVSVDIDFIANYFITNRDVDKEKLTKGFDTIMNAYSSKTSIKANQMIEYPKIYKSIMVNYLKEHLSFNVFNLSEMKKDDSNMLKTLTAILILED